MKDRTKTILTILAFVAIAAGLIIYGRTAQAPAEAPEVITTPEGQLEVGEGTGEAAEPIDTSPHTHPKIGTVPAKPAGVDQLAYESAKTEMQKAIDELTKNSRNYEAWLSVAIYEYSVFKNEKRAEELWLFVEKDRPQMVQPVANLANLYFKRGDLTKAAQYLEKTVKNEPKFIQGYNDLYEIYKTQNSTQKAINSLQQGIKDNPADHSLAVTLARYYVELGKIDEARVQFDVALTRAKESKNEQIIKSIEEEIEKLPE